MAHLCIKPACPPDCCGCNHAISESTMRQYAIHYAHLREKPLTTISDGGVFAGRTPQNVVLNGDDLDAAIIVELRLTRADSTVDGEIFSAKTQEKER